MAEILAAFQATVASGDGHFYTARACGGKSDDGLWQGWIEFTPVDGGTPIRSPRETTQPNRTDLVYWATGISTVFLEGALRRAMQRPRQGIVRILHPPAFEGPAVDREIALAPRGSSDHLKHPLGHHVEHQQ